MTTLAPPRRPLPSQRKAKAPAWMTGVGRGVISFGVLLGIWALSVQLVNTSTLFYPSPASVWDAFLEVTGHGLLPDFVAVSLARWATGIAVGLAAALPVALLLSLSRTLSDMMMPLLNFFHAIVEIAWIPLFVLWFGYSDITIVLSIAYVVFFLVLYNTLIGIRQVQARTIDALRVMGANKWQITKEVLLPGALPSIVTGLRLGAGFGWRSLVGAEMIAASSGLGYLIFSSRETQQTSRTVVGMIIIGILWLLIDRFYLRPLEVGTVERWGLVRRAK